MLKLSNGFRETHSFFVSLDHSGVHSKQFNGLTRRLLLKINHDC